MYGVKKEIVLGQFRNRISNLSKGAVFGNGNIGL